MATRRPLRVLHVIGGLQLGGAETVLYRLATAPSGGIEHEVICLGERDWYSTPLEERGITVHHLGMKSMASALGQLKALRRLIRRSNADVIQCWMYFANVLAGVMAPRGTPVVWGIHNSTFDHVRPASRFTAYVGGVGCRWLADFVVNCSQRSAEAHAKLGYSAVPHAVIPNGYDTSIFHPNDAARLATRASLGIGPDEFLAGSITRWHPEKDVPTLLGAMKILRDRGVPLRCLLIGPGLDASNPDVTRALAGLEETVIPLGRRADVPDLARALDLHILPSRSEAFPNVVAETMLSATPNAVTDVGDSAMIVGENGWIVPPGDQEALAGAIVQAYQEWRVRPADWARRRDAARESIAARFTFERMVEAYAAVWRQVVKAA